MSLKAKNLIAATLIFGSLGSLSIPHALAADSHAQHPQTTEAKKAPAKPAPQEQSPNGQPMDHGSMNPGAMDHGNMDHGKMDAMQPGDSSAMDHTHDQ